MSQLSFHAPGKTSCKMPTMVRETYALVREKLGKVRELFSDFCLDIDIDIDQWFIHVQPLVWSCVSISV